MTYSVANRLRNLIFAVALLGAAAGCSFAFVNGPPPNHEKIAYFDCSTSNALPTIDLLLAGAAAVDAIGGSVGASGLPTSKAELASFGVEAAAFAASAVYGYRKTSDCRSAQADMLKRASLMPTFANPSGFGPPQPPGFTPAPPVPYDPWVAPPAPTSPAPSGLSPVGPLPAAPAPAAKPAPATDGETPHSGKAVQ